MGQDINIVDDVWTLTNNEEDAASDELSELYVTPALDGNRKAQNYLRRLWDNESWESIKKKAEAERVEMLSDLRKQNEEVK